MDPLSSFLELLSVLGGLTGRRKKAEQRDRRDGVSAAEGGRLAGGGMAAVRATWVEEGRHGHDQHVIVTVMNQGPADAGHVHVTIHEKSHHLGRSLGRDQAASIGPFPFGANDDVLPAFERGDVVVRWTDRAGEVYESVVMPG